MGKKNQCVSYTGTNSLDECHYLYLIYPNKLKKLENDQNTNLKNRNLTYVPQP